MLIPQVTTNDLTDDDRVVQRRIAGFCRTEPFQVETLRDHYELKAMYGELDMLVGTRFHSVIFALTAGVPCIGIAYEHKTRGIMRELGLERWVIDIEAVTADDLIPLVERGARRGRRLPRGARRAHAAVHRARRRGRRAARRRLRPRAFRASAGEQRAQFTPGPRLRSALRSAENAGFFEPFARRTP